MVRLQEHYADLTMSRLGIGWDKFKEVIGVLTPPFAVGATERGRRLDRGAPMFPDASETSRAAFFALHPTRAEREAVWQTPELLLGDWRRVAWATAILSLGLDQILASPLFAYHSLRLHLYILTALLLVCTWVLPNLALGRSFRRELGRILLLIVVVRAVWLALNILLLGVQVFLSPSGALELLNSIVIAGSRYVGALDSLPVADLGLALSAVLAAVALEVLQLGGLLAAIGLYIVIMRRLVARYHDDLPRIRRIHWLSTLLVGALVYAVLWPLAGLL